LILITWIAIWGDIGFYGPAATTIPRLLPWALLLRAKEAGK